MPQKLSLSYYTCAPVSPLEQLRSARNAGYNCVGLRPVQPRPDAPVQSIFGDRALIREIANVSRDLGIQVFDLEFIWLDAAFDADRCKGLVELGVELGAEAILVGGLDPDWNRTVDNYAKLCALAAEGGLSVDVEFMPWAKVSTMASAVRLIQEAGNPLNGNLLIDAIHFFRANTPLIELSTLKPQIIHSVQLCDDIVRRAIPLVEARQVANLQRLPPNSGSLDLASFINALPKGTPIALEVPNEEEILRRGGEEWARICLRSAEPLLQGLGRL